MRTLIINKMFPQTVTDPFFKGRLEQQRKYRAQIDAEFPQQAKLELPLLSHDIDTLEALRKVAAHVERALLVRGDVVPTR